MLSRKSLFLIIRILLGVTLLGAIVACVEWQGVVNTLANISAIDVAVLLVISAALVLVSVVKWRGFLARLGVSRSVWTLYKLYLVGYFVNFFMPSSVGGDVVRSLYVGAKADRTSVLSATFLERYTGLIAMVCMALCALPFAPVISGGIGVLILMVGLGVLCTTWVLWQGSLCRALLRLTCSSRLVKVFDDLHSALLWGVSDAPWLRRAALLSVLFHVLTVVNTVAVASAVGWTSVSWFDLFAVVPLILLVGAIPLAPQGLGIQEGAALFFLHSVGATTAQALAVALVLRIKSYVLALIGGVIWVLSAHEHHRKGA